MKTTLDKKEVEKFTEISKEWWDENGKFKPLHKFNPIRISYIRDKIVKHFGLEEKNSEALKGLRILDIGCGGGLVAERFAKMGAKVTAIDAGEENINVAKIHAAESKVEVDYQVSLVEDFAELKNLRRTVAAPSCEDSNGKTNFDINNGSFCHVEKFDVVLALEIIEHVADVEEFVKNAAALVKKNGLFFVATINRTPKSFALAIVGAEYVLRWLKIGTHNWKKFLKPSEINDLAIKFDLDLKELKGFGYRIVSDQFFLTDDLQVNYIAAFSKVN